MRYFGGKARIGKQLAAVINQLDGTYWEPFCGVFSVGKHVTLPIRFGTDAHPDLILLLNAVRDGWEPPKVITEDEYNELKTAEPSPLRAFAGFGCSNSGKFFGGYARESTGRNFAANAANSLQNLRPLIQGVAFHLRHYLETEDLEADVIYCDPPYDGTTGFTVGRDGGKFCSATFWKWVRARSKCSIVLVSEYVAPDGFVPVWQKQVKTDMNGKKGKIARVEKLFVHQTHARRFK